MSEDFPASNSPPPRAMHLAEYAAELAGTACLVFFGLSAVVCNFSTGTPMAHWVPSHGLRLLLTGLCFSGTGSLVALSPLGRLSGGHINPSVSLAFWLGGKLRGRDLVGYVLAQMVGGMLGALLLTLAWRDHAASVQNGMTLPGTGWPLWSVFDGEVLMTGLLVLLILIFVSSRRLMRWTPLMNWLVVATMVWLEAPISGTSLNPARSFGPALMCNVWTRQWIYFVAPLLGAMVALGAFRLFTTEQRRLETGKLFHAPNYRSIFRPGAVRPGESLAPSAQATASS